MKTDLYYIILTCLKTGEVVRDFEVTLSELNILNAKNNIDYKIHIASREEGEI